MEIVDYFDAIFGMDSNDIFNKAGLILKCCDLCGCEKRETTLVGDSKNDFIGAQQAQVDFIGVTYGFGFKAEEKYEFQTVENCKDLMRIF